MPKPFHELTDDEYQALIVRGFTWQKLAQKHLQPTWCAYPNALDGLAGCWSLVGRQVTGAEFCKTCECYRSKGDPKLC